MRIINMKKFYLITFLFLIIIGLNSLAFASTNLTDIDLQEENLFIDSNKIPIQVINYAKRHNLQLEVDKYEIEKSDVEDGDKYKYIYPCSTKDGQIYAILYRNKFYIKTATPSALNIIYIGTR